LTLLYFGPDPLPVSVKTSKTDAALAQVRKKGV